MASVIAGSKLIYMFLVFVIYTRDQSSNYHSRIADTPTMGSKGPGDDIQIRPSFPSGRYSLTTIKE